MARTETAWRCSQCGAINESGSRACHECGKWPSLFDLQDSVDAPLAGDAEPGFDPEVFEPERFEPEMFEPAPHETGMPVETFEPEVDEVEGEEQPRSRFPRWAITAVWVLGLVVWFVVNALGDNG